MNLSDADHTYQIQSAEELDAILSRRYQVGGAALNSFWLSDESGFPCMSILVKDELATVWYWPSEGSAGCMSTNGNATSEKATTLFYLNHQRQEVGDHLIINWPQAVEAAREFLETRELPNSLLWIEL